MRTIPPALQTRFDSGVTTLCRCWVITRADGVTQGFTDHDDDITLDAVSCHAGGGLSSQQRAENEPRRKAILFRSELPHN